MWAGIQSLAEQMPKSNAVLQTYKVPRDRLFVVCPQAEYLDVFYAGYIRCHACSTSNAAMLRSSLLNSTPIR